MTHKFISAFTNGISDFIIENKFNLPVLVGRDSRGAGKIIENTIAAILNYRLTKLNKVIAIRRKNVENYKEYLDQKNVFIPKEEKYQFNSYHTFVVQADKRNQLKELILQQYPQYVETLLFKSIKKMKKASKEKIIDYVLLKCHL